MMKKSVLHFVADDRYGVFADNEKAQFEMLFSLISDYHVDEEITTTQSYQHYYYSLVNQPPNHAIHSFIHSFIHSLMMIMMKWEITNCDAISFEVIVFVGGVGMWRLISEMNIKLAFIDQISDHFFFVPCCRITHR